MEEYSIILFMLLCICCKKMNLRQNNFILECGSINLYFSFSQIILTNSEQRYNQLHLRSGDHVSRIFFLTKRLLITFYWSHYFLSSSISHINTFHSPSSVKMSKIIMAITHSLRGKCSRGRLACLAGHYTLHDSFQSLDVRLAVTPTSASKMRRHASTRLLLRCIRYLKLANERNSRSISV